MHETGFQTRGIQVFRSRKGTVDPEGPLIQPFRLLPMGDPGHGRNPEFADGRFALFQGKPFRRRFPMEGFLIGKTVQVDIQAVAVGKDPASASRLAMVQDPYFQLISVQAPDADVEVSPEGPDVPESHPGPRRSQSGRQPERPETCRADAEHSLRHDAGIQPALGGKMTLGPFRPGFDGIRDMVPQEPPGRIAVQEITRRSRVPGDIHATQGIQGGTVPEGFAPLLGKQAVLRHQFVGGQGGDGSFRALRQSHDERQADPGPEDLVAVIIPVGMEPLDLRSEIGFDRLGEPMGTGLVPPGLGSAPAEAPGEHRRREKSVIIQRGGGQVGLSRREPAFQFVRVGPDDTGGIPFPVAVLQAPFDEGPEFLRLFPAAAFEGIPGRSMGDHGGVAPVPGPVPDVGSFRDDGTGDGRIGGIHEPGEMPVSVQCRFISLPIAQEREEGIDVFRLVVGPDGGIVGFPAGTVHIPARRLVNAFGSADFGKTEFPVQHRVRCFQDQVSVHFVQVRPPGAPLRIQIGPQHVLPFPVGLEAGSEAEGFTGGEPEGSGAENIPPDDIGARNALIRRRSKDLGESGDEYGHRPVSQVLQLIGFTQERCAGRREDPPLHPHGRGRSRPSRGERTRHFQAAVQPDRFHLLVPQGIPVDADEGRDVHPHPVHQAGVRIVGDRPEHREDQGPFAVEGPVLSHAPSQHDGHLFAAHLDMVLAGQHRFRRCENDTGPSVFQGPAMRFPALPDGREDSK